MKSPLNGKEMRLTTRREMIEYQGTWITYNHVSWYDELSNESFTTTEQDEGNLNRIKNKREIYNGFPLRD